MSVFMPLPNVKTKQGILLVLVLDGCARKKCSNVQLMKYYITVEVLFIDIICIQPHVQVTESGGDHIFVIAEYLADHHVPLQVARMNEA
jgi:hypothetical protein